MSFQNLKRKSIDKFRDLATKMESENSRQSFTDDRFWNPTLDNAGNRICCY